jgi:hypothetical protein
MDAVSYCFFHLALEQQESLELFHHSSIRLHYVVLNLAQGWPGSRLPSSHTAGSCPWRHSRIPLLFLPACFTPSVFPSKSLYPFLFRKLPDWYKIQQQVCDDVGVAEHSLYSIWEMACFKVGPSYHLSRHVSFRSVDRPGKCGTVNWFDTLAVSLILSNFSCVNFCGI